MAQNTETQMTLDDAVAEVLGLLTGLDLVYQPELNRYYAIARQLNRALRSNALEREWSWYADTYTIGNAVCGEDSAYVSSQRRPRIINDDCVRLVDSDGKVRRWAYFLPRDALHKYSHRNGLWCSVIRDAVLFSRPFTSTEDGWEIRLPVMREPTMFRLPPQSEDYDAPRTTVPSATRNQLIDFNYPDVIILRAAYYYASTDPVMQPRAQTLEAQYKDLMFQAIERDERYTDSPELNPFFVPIDGDLFGGDGFSHRHPHADERR